MKSGGRRSSQVTDSTALFGFAGDFIGGELRGVPVRMQRPAGAGQALGLSPLVEAGGANSTSVERVPLIAAGAEPEIILAR